MTLDSTTLHARTLPSDHEPSYPLDPLSGGRDRAAAAIIPASEHCTPTLRFVMI